jgi:hypothetical protein
VFDGIDNGGSDTGNEIGLKNIDDKYNDNNPQKHVFFFGKKSIKELKDDIVV